MKIPQRIDSSFRDPCGFMFEWENEFYRQVNQIYADDYNRLMSSGLYEKLTQKGWLIPHEAVENIAMPNPEIGYKVLKPQQLSFISYPASWSFSMLKDAALLTLSIQKKALGHGMTLKDASAYNIQFEGCKPIFIDTLSFEKHKEGQAWQAYGQFCRHFLAPLALMSKTDISLSKLLTLHIDGIPLNIASKLLPLKSHFNLGLNLHIHTHARLLTRYQNPKKEATAAKFSLKSFQQLVDNLVSTVDNLTWKPVDTEWFDYYDKSTGDTYLKDKIDSVTAFLTTIGSRDCIVDLGANDGTFSKIASSYAQKVLSFDIDPACVELNYLQLKKEKHPSITPLVVDLVNPEPGIGWQNKERKPLFERIKADTIMALALIHHLCISNNIPLSMVADFLSKKCTFLIIEFVPKSDEKVQLLLKHRVDIFTDYTLENFENTFAHSFDILQKRKIDTTDRVLFLMKKRG
jgi:23S rRNA U2552 (ribose-2'-O)-methylase RlmE/FtsJ